MAIPANKLPPTGADADADRISRSLGFRRVLEATRIVQWEADARTRDFTYVGSQAERLLGYPLARWLEPSFWKRHLHPDDRERVLRFREEALIEKEAYEFEYRMMAAGGHSVWVHDVVAVERVDGAPAVIRGFLIDVTAQKRAEATARAGQARVRQLVEQAPDAIIVVRADGQIAFVNHQAERLFGYQAAELMRRAVEDLLPGQLGRHGFPAPPDGGAAERANPAGAGRDLGRRADGGTFPVALNFGRLEIDEGLVLVVTVRDITDQIEAEAALRQSEERFRIAATLGADIIAEVDFRTGAVVWFGQVDRALGYQPGEFPRTVDGWRTQLHAADRDRVQVRIERELLGSGRELSFDARVRAKDGSYRHWTVRAAPRLEETGPPTKVVAVCSDVTEQIVARAEAIRHRDALAHVARVSSLGELTAALAHELNQPLAGILSNAQTAIRLLDREVPDVREVGEVLQDIVADDHRAGAIIQRLREMMRRDTPARAPVDLGQIVQEVRELLRGELAGRGVIVVADFAGDLPPVVADRIQIQQVVVNLVTNAMQAMEGMEDPRLTLRVSGRRDGWQVVSVSDTGPGIQGSMLDTIFEPFNTSRAAGLGMGLSISRSIVEAHGGDIEAENLAGGGAAVRFALPTERTGDQ